MEGQDSLAPLGAMVEARMKTWYSQKNHRSWSERWCEMDFVHPQPVGQCKFCTDTYGRAGLSMRVLLVEMYFGKSAGTSLLRTDLRYVHYGCRDGVLLFALRVKYRSSCLAGGATLPALFVQNVNGPANWGAHMPTGSVNLTLLPSQKTVRCVQGSCLGATHSGEQITHASLCVNWCAGFRGILSYPSLLYRELIHDSVLASPALRQIQSRI